MQTTTNYGFKTYQSGDLFNPLTVENANMETLDTDLKAISDRSIGRATELVSSGVHAITLLDTDCVTFKFVATGNFTEGETFTLNGIAINANYPDGTPLKTDAFTTGAVVMASRNADDSVLTFYLSSVGGVAPDSAKLGGELPAYYATKDYADGIKSTADSASALIQKKALVNTYYDSSTNKLYVVNSDGTQGGEIVMNRKLNFSNKQELTTSAITTSKDGTILGIIYNTNILVNNDQIWHIGSNYMSVYGEGIPAGSELKLSANNGSNTHVWFVPFA